MNVFEAPQAWTDLHPERKGDKAFWQKVAQVLESQGINPKDATARQIRNGIFCAGMDDKVGGKLIGADA